MKYLKTFEEFIANSNEEEIRDVVKVPATEEESQEEIKPEDETSESGKELNERSRLKSMGTYRAKDGSTYNKFRDDENYISIQVGDTYVTIEGDGEVKSQDDVMKEIQAAKDFEKNDKNNKFRHMSNADFKKHMRGY